MFKFNSIKTIALVAAGVAFGSQAQAAKLAILDVHLMGGWTGASAERTQGGGADFSTTKAMSYGIGAGVELPLADSLGIVTGLDYVHRRFEIGYTGMRAERTVPTIFVPVMLRGWVSDAFYLQGGVYGSKGVGSIKDKAVLGDLESGDLSSSARRSVDFGLTGGLGINLAFFGKTGIYVQGQYLHGLTDSSGSSLYKEQVRDILVSTGLRIEL